MRDKCEVKATVYSFGRKRVGFDRVTTIEGAYPFPHALKRFQAWAYSYGSFRFCSWGDYDKTQFERDCQRHSVGYPFPGKHLNLKLAFRERSGLKKKLGVGQALKYLGLEFEGRAHRGVDDARNIARIVAVAARFPGGEV